MADTYTTSLRLDQPENGADSNIWGTILNTDLALIEAAITGVAAINLAGKTALTLTANNGTADQARNAVYSFTGAMAGNCVVTLPQVAKTGWAYNGATGGTLTLTTGLGTTLALHAGTWTLFYCDGTNVTAPQINFDFHDTTISGALTVTSGTTLEAGGTWSSANWGKQLLIQSSAPSNPSLGIADSNGANLWGIGNNGGALILARMPAWSDSTTAPAIVGQFTSGGFSVTGTLAVSGAVTFSGAVTAAAATIGGSPVVTNNGGTWTINISGSASYAASAGSAGSATSAGTVPWSGVTGKPYTPNQNVDQGANPIFGLVQGNAYAAYTAGHTFNLGWGGTTLGFEIDGTIQGAINYTPSDYRLKHSIACAPPGALADIARMRPVTYRFRDVGAFRDDGRARLGFIAHELAEVVPSAVDGEKDAVAEDGAILPQSLQPMPLIALLSKGSQEMQSLIAAQSRAIEVLTARIAALEARA